MVWGALASTRHSRLSLVPPRLETAKTEPRIVPVLVLAAIPLMTRSLTLNAARRTACSTEPFMITASTAAGLMSTIQPGLLLVAISPGYRVLFLCVPYQE